MFRFEAKGCCIFTLPNLPVVFKVGRENVQQSLLRVWVNSLEAYDTGLLRNIQGIQEDICTLKLFCLPPSVFRAL